MVQIVDNSRQMLGPNLPHYRRAFQLHKILHWSHSFIAARLSALLQNSYASSLTQIDN